MTMLDDKGPFQNYGIFFPRRKKRIQKVKPNSKQTLKINPTKNTY